MKPCHIKKKKKKLTIRLFISLPKFVVEVSMELGITWHLYNKNKEIKKKKNIETITSTYKYKLLSWLDSFAMTVPFFQFFFWVNSVIFH
jgi:hypothetical protein